MKKFSVILTIAVSIGCAAADDSNWQQYAKSNGQRHLFHRGKIAADGLNGYLVWEKTIKNKPSPVYLDDSGPLSSYSLSKLRIDCQAQTVQVISTVHYDVNGRVVPGRAFFGPPSPIPPDSIGEALAEMFCFK